MPTKKEFFSIPNVLTYIRILLVPVIVYMYYVVEENTVHMYSSSLLIMSSLTDFLDGYIARKWNLITDWGKLIDPIADKLTQLVVAIMLLSTYTSYRYIIAIIIVKDAMLLFFQYYIYKESGQHIPQAEMPGKIATAVFFIVSIILLVFKIPNTLFASILIDITGILLFMALIHYATLLFGYYAKMKG